MRLIVGYILGLTFDVPFILDDHSKIVLNLDLRSWEGLWGKLFHSYEYGLSQTRNDPSRPLVYLLYRGLYQVGQGTPWPFHLFNGVIHLINGMLSFFLTTILLKSVGRQQSWAYGMAGVVGCLFLITPINGGTFASIYGTCDLLSNFWTAFYLVASALPWRQDGAKKVALALILILSLLTKQSLVMIPLIGILFDGARNIWPQKSARAWFGTCGLSVGVMVFYLMGRRFLLGGWGDLEGGSHVKPWLSYFLAQPQAIAHYARGVFIPWKLCLDHAPEIAESEWVLYGGQMLLLCGVTSGIMGVLWRRRNHPDTRLLAFGLIFCGLWLVPTSSFLPTVDFMVERRIYGGSFGLVLGATYFVALVVDTILPGPKGRGWLLTLLASYLVVLGGYRLSVYRG